MKKILYISTLSMTINSFLVPHIKMLNTNGIIVDVACHKIDELSSELINLIGNAYEVSFSRNPLDYGNVRAYKEIYKLLSSEDYDSIHVHTPVAATVTRLAAKKNFEGKIFYTAHGFHFFKDSPKINWLTYYPIERYLSKYTDVLITMNNEDYETAKKMKSKSVKKVSGVGIDIDKYQKTYDLTDLKQELKINKNMFIITSIGELNKNKNHKIVIEALAGLKDIPFKYFICGVGPKNKYLQNIINRYGLQDKVILLGYRRDIPKILSLTDLFIFPSRREGLPVSVMEAMASGIPIIGSNIRGNNDLIDHGKGGYLFDLSNCKELSIYIKQVFNDEQLRLHLSNHNCKKAKNYSVDNVIKEMEYIYKIK